VEEKKRDIDVSSNDEWISEFVRVLKQRGLRVSDLERIMTAYPSEKITRAYKKIMRKRKKTKEVKVPTKIEEYLDKFYSNHLREKGKVPEKKTVRAMLNFYFDIPLNSRGKLPVHIERIIERVRVRTYNRFRYEKRKIQSSESKLGG
jgi:acetolactate synthase regulatory subunit